MNKKMVGTAFFVIIVTMSLLVGGFYVAINAYVDPVLQDLSMTVTGLESEAQTRLAPRLEALQQIRDMAFLHIPAILFLSGLFMILVVSPLLRRSGETEAMPRRRKEKETADDKPAKGVQREPDPGQFIDAGACRIMAILQKNGRLIDFLEEDIGGFPDDQIGAAVRHIHEDCGNALREYVTLTPVMPEHEGDTVVVPQGFDPSEIRLTGQVSGKGPFQGTLQHPGWKVTEIKLPDQPKGQKHTVIAPAEVEIEA
jgi:hypothetical protein